MAKSKTTQTVKACTAKPSHGKRGGWRKMCSGTKKVCRYAKGSARRIGGRKAGGLFKSC